VVVDAQATFLAPARFDEEIDLSYAIERLGTTSMTVAAAAWRDDTALVEGRMVYVFVDPQTLKKREIPAAVRERLAPWVTG
jgi:acyl-CoA thioester hydrolase